MNISKDTNGIYYLKWDGGDHGIDHKITDSEDPRSEMNYITKEDHNGKTLYFYGVMLSIKRPALGTTTNRKSFKPFIEMTKTWLKQNITFFEGGENKTIIMKKNKDGRWNAVLRSMIRLTI